MGDSASLKAFVSQPDLAFSETNNVFSRGVWVRIGGRVIPGYSLKWIRPLRPLEAAIEVLGARLSAFRLLHPIAALTDRILLRTKGSLSWNAPAPVAGFTTIEVDRGEMAGILVQLTGRYGLRPAWRPAQLAYRLDHAASLTERGALVCCKVIDRRGALAGVYLYYARRDGVAMALQVAAEEEATYAVICSLLQDAQERGAVALWGRSEPALLDGLLQARCILVNGGFTTVYSKDKEIVSAIVRGDAMLTGLAGEYWSHFMGGLMSKKKTTWNTAH